MQREISRDSQTQGKHEHSGGEDIGLGWWLKKVQKETPLFKRSWFSCSPPRKIKAYVVRYVELMKEGPCPHKQSKIQKR